MAKRKQTRADAGAIKDAGVVYRDPSVPSPAVLLARIAMLESALADILRVNTAYKCHAHARAALSRRLGGTESA